MRKPVLARLTAEESSSSDDCPANLSGLGLPLGDGEGGVGVIHETCEGRVRSGVSDDGALCNPAG